MHMLVKNVLLQPELSLLNLAKWGIVSVQRNIDVFPDALIPRRLPKLRSNPDIRRLRRSHYIED